MREVKGVTYKIIGGDGREYGPIELNELRAWIGGDRVERATRIWSSDDGCWIPAGERSELRWDLPEAAALPPELSTVSGPSTRSVGTGGSAGELMPAALLPRLSAIAFDYILFNFTLWLLTIPWAREWEELQPAVLASIRKGESDPALTLALLRQLFSSVVPISFAYYALLPLLLGGTPGKLLAGIRVVQTDGSPLSWNRAVVRWLGGLACLATFGLGLLPLFFTPRRQGLHDLMAGTYVVHSPPS